MSGALAGAATARVRPEAAGPAADPAAGTGSADRGVVASGRTSGVADSALGSRSGKLTRTDEGTGRGSDSNTSGSTSTAAITRTAAPMKRRRTRARRASALAESSGAAARRARLARSGERFKEEMKPIRIGMPHTAEVGDGGPGRIWGAARRWHAADGLRRRPGGQLEGQPGPRCAAPSRGSPSSSTPPTV